MIDGLFVRPSADGFVATVDRMDSWLSKHGIRPMARIDHAAGAREAGLELPPLLVVVFGNPMIGTALMRDRPSIGIDLPLRLAIWLEGGRTMVGYNDPRWLAERHGVNRQAKQIEKMTEIVTDLAAFTAGRAC